ncbi:uncharacterized protein Pyn_31729 [Prunus yedoensis var. nudiflora]|uniref:Uncharacterized protein n=1 Tax=Prunus yedoensis var. nudiflora TaxID=2094558 RepID=A0A314UC11_PRUYE|nr:uncharacterized protein Pyn_31729 [Prunus yedoensis var. nudiflora]
MLKFLNKSLLRLCHRLRWSVRRRSRPKVVIKRFGKTNSKKLNLRLGMKLALMGRRQFTLTVNWVT